MVKPVLSQYGPYLFDNPAMSVMQVQVLAKNMAGLTLTANDVRFLNSTYQNSKAKPVTTTPTTTTTPSETTTGTGSSTT